MKNNIISISVFLLLINLFSCDYIKVADIQKITNQVVPSETGNKNQVFAYITESKIVSKQLVGSTIDPNYVHDKALRAQLTTINKNNLDSLISVPTFADSVQSKKVLLEYFTGHKCGNCPVASNPVFDLIKITYPNQVNIIKIHADFFALPSNSYPTDFRTTPGTELFAALGVSSMPIAAINRIEFPNASKLINTTDWIAKIDEELKKKPIFGLWQSHSVSSNKDILLQIKIKNLETKKIYGVTCKGTLKPEWVTKNCKIVIIITDEFGNVIQSIENPVNA